MKKQKYTYEDVTVSTFSFLEAFYLINAQLIQSGKSLEDSLVIVREDNCSHIVTASHNCIDVAKMTYGEYLIHTTPKEADSSNKLDWSKLIMETVPAIQLDQYPKVIDKNQKNESN